jgi:hypothetical protein
MKGLEEGMDGNTINEVFNPLLNDAYQRFIKRTKRDRAYVETVFAPLLSAIGRAARVDAQTAINSLTALDPTTLTKSDVYETVSKLTAPVTVSDFDIASARARQAEVDADIASYAG